jgi:hypothetical protein
VEMIVHQALGMHLGPGLRAGLLQGLEEVRAIHILQQAVLPSVTPDRLFAASAQAFRNWPPTRTAWGPPAGCSASSTPGAATSSRPPPASAPWNVVPTAASAGPYRESTTGRAARVDLPPHELLRRFLQPPKECRERGRRHRHGRECNAPIRLPRSLHSFGGFDPTPCLRLYMPRQ